MESTCARCTAPFVPRSGGKPQKYCSPACRLAVDADREKAKREAALAERLKLRPTECLACGAPIEQSPLGQPRKYCSTKCNAKVQNRRMSRRRPPKPAQIEKLCAHCDKAFTPKRSDRMYCYDGWCCQAAYAARRAAGETLRQVAHDVVCDGCGVVFVGVHPRARWCSQECATRHWTRVNNRRRQKPSASSAPYTDRQIYLRDKWRCHLCGEPLDRKAKFPDRRSPSIDHLVPLALGGTDTPANVAAAHWGCNRAKGVNAADEQLRIL